MGLWKLNEQGLLELIAAFAGVERGRRLRNIREFAGMLAAVIEMEDEEQGYTSSDASLPSLVDDSGPFWD